MLIQYYGIYKCCKSPRYNSSNTKKNIYLRLMQCTKKTKAKSSEITLAIYHI